ncbi:MAG: 2-oxoacid:acceptor oxidoreductase subunit alpha [Dehalococcoidia bacterium]|nr:2-oxoacid:acceptor oxidoreductase subunit alpha [Dehalococcoidia bacterium]
METVLLEGNEACARGALAAGCRFYAGYPITPSTEIMEFMSRELPKLGGMFIQMEDEMGSMGAVIGASLAGVKAMTATSGPGFSLMQEHIGFASMAEVPCVIALVMRGGPSTGLPTQPSQADVMQAAWGTHGDHPVIVLSASSAYETFDLTIKAFNLAERYRTPVIMMTDAIVAHTREAVTLPDADVEIEDRPQPTGTPEEFMAYADPGNGVPPMPPFGDGYRYHVTGLCHDVRGFPTTRSDEVDFLLRRLLSKITRDSDRLQWFDRWHENSETMVIAHGCVARAALRAVRQVRDKGLDVGLIKPKILWPFMSTTISNVLDNCRRVLVPEMNFGQISREVERVNQGRCEIVTLNKVDGTAITPPEIVQKLEEMQL